MSLSSLFLRRAPHALARSASCTTPRLCLKRRSAHTMPQLNHIEQFEKEGVAGAFSRTAFKTCWTDYQGGLVDNLNRLIAETAFEKNAPLEIAIMTARQADLAATFNYASQAHNNHFFFEALSPTPVQMPEPLVTLIPYSWADKDALKAEFLTTAMKMFGCGWVWLVVDKGRDLRILCTYNAGTPYSSAYRRQDTDMNTRQSLGYLQQEMPIATGAAPQTSAVNWAIPLLNINVWEHAWLQDFGVNGKGDYLEAVWAAIDWNIVVSRGGFRNIVRPMLSA